MKRICRLDCLPSWKKSSPMSLVCLPLFDWNAANFRTSLQQKSLQSLGQSFSGSACSLQTAC